MGFAPAKDAQFFADHFRDFWQSVGQR